MARKARSAWIARCLEVLEHRTLLSGSTSADLFVRFQDGTPQSAIQGAFQTLKATLEQSYPNGPDLISVGQGVDPNLALRWLNADPYVRYAEANAPVHQSAAFIPNDPSFGSQWGLNNGNDVDIDAPEAWTITQGDPSVIVAILDTGIDLKNAEFAGRLWVNPAPGSGGYHNDVNGWNFIQNTNNVQDNNGHGTHVAGILAASGNNGIGVAGVALNVRIMPVKVLDAFGDGATDAAVAGIYYAVQHGARVINASWGGGLYSQAMHDALSYANDHGVVFVTAAGNDSANTDNAPSYPGGYRLPNEIAVAAIDSSGQLANFSDYGTQTVDLAAPGVDIYSTIPHGGYENLSGTSMASPYVAGVVALVAGLLPNASAAQLVQRVLSTTKPDANLVGKTAHGIVDAYNAVNLNAPPPNSAKAFDPNAFIPNGSSQTAVIARVLATDDVWNSLGGTVNGFVTGVYRSLLGRLPDDEGMAHWVDKLESGESRTDMILEFARTPEALRYKVALWYQDDLGWTTPISVLKKNDGVGYWADLLASGQSDSTVLGKMLATDDYFAAHGGNNRDFLTGLYQSLLGRVTDPVGFNYFLGLLQSGKSRADVIRMIQLTDEAKQTTVARWYIEQLGWSDTVSHLKINAGVQYWASYIGNI